MSDKSTKPSTSKMRSHSAYNPERSASVGVVLGAMILAPIGCGPPRPSIVPDSRRGRDVIAAVTEA